MKVFSIFFAAILIISTIKPSFSKGFSHLDKEPEVVRNRISHPSEASYVGKKYFVRESERRVEKDDIYDQEQSDYNNRQYTGYYKIGNSYQIDGITYRPQEYGNYEEVGEASWYGSDFDGKLTANGEIYDMHALTAAHRTLPLPSMVKVTNLANGKNIIVRVNDRGPFANDRIIDLSKKSAEILGFRNKGLTNVKLEFLKEETNNLLSKLNLKQND